MKADLHLNDSSQVDHGKRLALIFWALINNNVVTLLVYAVL